MSKGVLQSQALNALEGVGDKKLGQWEEWSGKAYHLRRRLSHEEQSQVGEAKDIRGTQEDIKRNAAVKQFLPDHLKDWKE